MRTANSHPLFFGLEFTMAEYRRPGSEKARALPLVCGIPKTENLIVLTSAFQPLLALGDEGIQLLFVHVLYRVLGESVRAEDLDVDLRGEVLFQLIALVQLHLPRRPVGLMIFLATGLQVREVAAVGGLLPRFHTLFPRR